MMIQAIKPAHPTVLRMASCAQLNSLNIAKKKGIE